MTGMGKAWRTQEPTFEYTFTTGRTATLRPLSARVLLLDTVPDVLTPLVAEILTGSLSGVGPVADQTLKKVDDLRALHTLCDTLARDMFVSPRIVDANPDDDAITLHDLLDDERWELLFLVGKAVELLKSFRAGQAETLDRLDVAAGAAPTGE